MATLCKDFIWMWPYDFFRQVIIFTVFYIHSLVWNFFQVLQNLGKADKTTDGKFEDHVADFTRQQVATII